MTLAQSNCTDYTVAQIGQNIDAALDTFDRRVGGAFRVRRVVEGRFGIVKGVKASVVFLERGGGAAGYPADMVFFYCNRNSSVECKGVIAARNSNLRGAEHFLGERELRGLSRAVKRNAVDRAVAVCRDVAVETGNCREDYRFGSSAFSCIGGTRDIA